MAALIRTNRAALPSLTSAPEYVPSPGLVRFYAEPNHAMCRPIGNWLEAKVILTCICYGSPENY